MRAERGGAVHMITLSRPEKLNAFSGTIREDLLARLREAEQDDEVLLASDHAKFGETFAKIGLHPDWGGSWTMPALVGSGHAPEMVFTGGMIDGTRALEIGLVNRVVPHDELEEAVRKLSASLAQGAPRALQWAKHTLNEPTREALVAAMDREIEAQLALFATEDFAEGLAAFRGKREPKYTGL